MAAASEQDGPQAAALVDSQPERRRPERLLGDTAYGMGPVRAELAAREVEVLAPVPAGPVAEGRLAKRDFDVDLDAGSVTCPAGQVTEIRTLPSGRREARFRQSVSVTARCAPVALARAAAAGLSRSSPTRAY